MAEAMLATIMAATVGDLVMAVSSTWRPLRMMGSKACTNELPLNSPATLVTNYAGDSLPSRSCVKSLMMDLRGCPHGGGRASPAQGGSWFS